jgi:hypothetical protein
MTAYNALAVVGVDLGRLAFTATEVQTVADIAATAGARTLYDNAFEGGTRNVVADAQATVASTGNKMDGTAASIAAGDVEVGVYDFQAETFTPTTNDPNAVRATGRKTVTNFLAAALGSSQTEVVKQAVAPFSGPASGCAPPGNCAANDWACYCTNGSAPCLPIAAPDCAFTTNGQLPSLRVSNSTNDTAAWTGFSDHDAATIAGLLDQGPCNASSGAAPPEQSVGASTVDLTNGLSSACAAQNQAWGLMKCIFDNRLGCSDTNGDGVPDAAGGTMFTIPIFDLPSCTTSMNQVRPVVGFATVNITNVCPGNVRQIDLQTIARTSGTPEPTGAECFGTDCRVVLVQ